MLGDTRGYGGAAGGDRRGSGDGRSSIVAARLRLAADAVFDNARQRRKCRIAGIWSAGVMGGVMGRERELSVGAGAEDQVDRGDQIMTARRQRGVGQAGFGRGCED